MYVDLNFVTVGDKLAIDNDAHSSRASYTFCTATRVTKQFVEVTNDAPGHDGTTAVTKFSKATAKPLQASSWDARKRLVTAENARDTMHRRAAMDAIRAERREIQNGLTKIAQGHWTAETVAELRALAERMEQSIE